MKQFAAIKNQAGQATLVMVLVVLSVIIVVVAAVGLLTYNDIRSIGNAMSSSQSYYAAEAGIEDALLRIIKNMNYSNNYTLNVASASTNVDISGPLTSLVITSKGNMDNRFRKVEVDLGATQTATNVSFNYGVQVGYGGLHMDNGSRINGNVFSNGPITSAPNNPAITGTAFSASGSNATADQSNETPMPANNSITFGNGSSTQDVGQSFQVATTNTVNRVELYIKKEGAPADLTVRVTNDSGGNPGSTTVAQGTLDANLVTTNFGWVNVNFTSSPQLNSGATYWLVLDGGSNASKYYLWAANNTYSSGQAKTGSYSGGPWNATGLDGYFRLYTGGIVGLIDGIDIGIAGTGDAHANTITGSTATGILYCQSGSGNNKACDTSQADPTPQNLPLSQANIDQWQLEAADRGRISGDYTPPGITSSLGPTEITGNLIIPVGYILNIRGTVWVHGHIQVNSDAHISLDPGFGSDSGLILANGYINIGNNTIFSGSGQAGSYIMLLTTNDCNGTLSPTGQTCTTNDSAMYVSNNAQNVILYAAYGQLRLNQGANTKEATAYRLYLEENVTVSYESGLINSNFTSGPGGGFNIKSWKEVE